MLLAVKSFEIFPKHKGYFFISEPLANKNKQIDKLTSLTNKKLLLLL